MNNDSNDKYDIPKYIDVRDAHVHNLKHINIDIPLNKLVGIAGVSGSGKSSLALGVLYAEGSRRYLESLSTYTRRRMTSAPEAKVESVINIPAALALHQRPAVPSIRSTFGTSTELLNSLRLMFSRLGSHVCPNGHHVPPTEAVALGKRLVCPICHTEFDPPSAEDFAFNSQGACPDCGGTGIKIVVDESTLIPDENLSIDEGAVAPWNSLMWSLMTQVCREMGVRTDIPYKDLTPEEKEIVLHGPAVKKHILYQSKSNNNDVAELDFTYYNAVYTVENALSKVKDESGMKRVEKFLKQDVCPSCHGSRLNERARSTTLLGKSLDQVSSLTLTEAIEWVKKVPDQMPSTLKNLASSVSEEFLHTAKRLVDLGLSYLTLDRTSSTLSTGERQRVQLARAVRNRTTGVLYVLDEPTIGLHPANVDGLMDMIDDLLNNGNSVVLVDHDTRILAKADHLIELGPKAGDEGGNVIYQGSVSDIKDSESSIIKTYIDEKKPIMAREIASKEDMFKYGCIHLETGSIHTVKPLKIDIPKGRLTCITGVSGSGKTTLILESLLPALEALINHTHLPKHVLDIKADGIKRVNLIDATPIGANVRSTVATYSSVLDDFRKIYTKLEDAKKLNKKASDFSYNTGSLRCHNCDGTGQINLDVQFLPDVDLPCPVCHGNRYSEEADKIRWIPTIGAKPISLPELLSYTISKALSILPKNSSAYKKLEILEEVGLGYLTLGEATPSLSGGEAQRLKLASEIGRIQEDAVFIFDEPTIGLHPQDVIVLINTFQKLIDNKATVIVIEHDLDLINNADYIIDMGPQGGIEGGRIVAFGTKEDIISSKESLTAKYLK